MHNQFRALKRELWDILKKKLRAHTFNGRRKDGIFQKVYSWGTAQFVLTFVDHPDDVDVVTYVSLRIDSLANLVLLGDSRFTEERKKSVSSIMVEVGNVIQGSQLRWTLRSESDVGKVADSIELTFVEHVLPFIMRYSSLELLYSFFARDDTPATTLCPPGLMRAKSAVAVAKLLGKTSREIGMVVAKKREFLEFNHQSVTDVSDFLRFVALLNTDARG